MTGKDTRGSNGWARAAIALLAVVGALHFLAVLSDAAQASLIKRSINGGHVTHAAAVANDARVHFIAVLQIWVYVITGVVFLVWLYRAYKALRHVGTGETRFSPGWSVGYWLIPIINLFRPYQIVKEVWLRSESGNVGGEGNLPAPPIIGLWWLAFLVSGVFSRLARPIAEAATTRQQLLFLSWSWAVVHAVALAAAVLAILVVRGISSRQERMRDLPPPMMPPDALAEVTSPADG